MKQGKKTNCKKKKRSPPQKKVNNDVTEKQNEAEKNQETKILNSLMEAFSLSCLEEAASAYLEADRDPNKAAYILGLRLEDSTGCFSAGDISGSSSGSGPGSTSSEGSNHNVLKKELRAGGNRKTKKVIASTGTVSTVLGKDYVRRDTMKSKGLPVNKQQVVDKDEAEQFLCSMLGDECELSFAVVRDVFCQCGYNVEQALDVLLDLAASYREQSYNSRFSSQSSNDNEDTGLFFDHSGSCTDMGSDSASQSSENNLQDTMRSMGNSTRNYFKVLTTPGVHSPTNEKVSELDLPRAVLDSLFNVPRSDEHDPSTMNWRNVIKKFELLGQKMDSCHSHTNDVQQINPDKGDEYQIFRKPVAPQWDLVRTCYQRAATAYSKGEHGYAAYLSEQGKLHTKKAREADEKASQQIFKARNRNIENVITIDLHGQHVKPALKLLKLHLLFGTYVSSIQTIRVITGCGSHGIGKSKLKESVINLVKREGIAWTEENRGTVLIRLNGQREFHFLDSDSETE